MISTLDGEIGYQKKVYRLDLMQYTFFDQAVSGTSLNRNYFLNFGAAISGW